ncbi:MAG: FAD-binding oxidoreductase [Burkholderiaceae bacterium]
MKPQDFDPGSLARDVRGKVLTPGDIGYDEARALWNAMIDRRPAAIVRSRDARDVRSAVAAAVKAGLPIAIRGGGHNIAGLGLCDGGLVVDLSDMRAVTVDRRAGTVSAQGGALLKDLDAAAQREGLVVPGGVVSSTGIAGLTLGGGFGWLSRSLGLTADNLLAAELVDAAGRLLTVDAQSHPDLLWALRGGGGNFGVVTRFTFRAHALAHPVLFGPTVHRLDDAPAVLRHYRDFCAQAPRDCCVWADLCTAPPLPFLAPQHHGTKVVILMQCFRGDPHEGERVLAPLREFGRPLGDAVAPTAVCEAQSRLDDTYAHGARNYWGSQSYRALDDATIDRLVALAHTLPSAESDILLSQLGGAIDDVAADESAYPHRGIAFIVSAGARWRDPSDDARCIDWIRQANARLASGASGNAYVNFEPETQASGRRVYGGSLPRLRRIKQRYDPANAFCVNHNIEPNR